MNGTRFQRGHLYEAFGSFHAKFYQTEVVDGVLVRRRRSKRLCAVDKEHYSWLSRPARQPAKSLFRFTNSTEFHTDDGHGAPVSPSRNLSIPILELFDSFAPLLDQPQLSRLTTHFAPMTGRSRCLHE